MLSEDDYSEQFDGLIKKIESVNHDILDLQSTNVVESRETISHYDVLMQKKAALIGLKAEVVKKYYEILSDNDVEIQKKKKQLEQLEALLKQYF